MIHSPIKIPLCIDQRQNLVNTNVYQHSDCIKIQTQKHFFHTEAVETPKLYKLYVKGSLQSSKFTKKKDILKAGCITYDT